MLDKPIIAAPQAELEIELCDGFPAVIDDAAAAADPSHHFLRRAWFEAAGGKRPVTLTARRGSRIIAALPTALSGGARLGIRSVPGSYWPFRSFPVAADATDADLAAMLSSPAARRGLGWAWRLGPVASDDPSALRLLRVARRSGWLALSRSVGTFYVLDVGEEKKTGPWPRPSTVRNNHKHVKRLQKLGELDWRFIAGSGWSEAIFHDLARIERNSWVATKSGADPKFIDPSRRSGWQRLADDPVIAGMMSAGILYIGGEPVSFSFGIDAGRTRYSIATSYDERFAKHSPGTVTGYRTYEASAERGMQLLNLGSGDGGQKSGMGAVEGPAVMDHLFVRNPLAALLRPRRG